MLGIRNAEHAGSVRSQGRPPRSQRLCGEIAFGCGRTAPCSSVVSFIPLVAAPLPYYYALELAFFLTRFMAALLWSAQASSEPHTHLSLIKHVPGKFGAEPARSSSCSSTSEGWEKISQGERFLRTSGGGAGGLNAEFCWRGCFFNGPTAPAGAGCKAGPDSRSERFLRTPG